MGRSTKIPAGFYNASQAIKRLGVPRSTFYDWVEKGTIKKFVEPGKSDAYYLKAAIDDLAKARELFTIQYAADTTVFEKANETDVQGIYDLAVSLWGTRGTYPYEMRLARYKKNPEIFYVLKYMDVVVGYVTFMPVSTKAVEELKTTGKRASSVITLDDILPFTPGEEIEYVFLEIAVRDGVPKPKQYGMRLVLGMSDVMEDFAKREIKFKKLFGTSRTSDGIEMSRKIGFKESSLPSNEGTLFFELDTETNNHPLLEGYQKIIKK